jgi:hypothetical protein
MKKFVSQSPDPLLKKEGDMALAKLGHLNKIVDDLNDAIKYEYASVAAAKAAGLPVGTFFSNSAGSIFVIKA